MALPPRLIVLAVLGTVGMKSMSVIEDRLTPLLSSQGSTVKFIWFDQGPIAVDQTYISQRVA